MASRAPTLALAALLAAAGLAGCADRGEPWSLERETTIESGSFLEVNLAMNASAELAYRWSTTPARELAFDVHSHPSEDEVADHQRADATESEGTFTAPSEGTYSLMWRNEGEQAVTLALALEGEAALVSVVPEDPGPRD